MGEARSRFEPANIDSADVDFSDRVDDKRKSYKTSSRRQRILEDGTRELGDLSDDDDEESLERRIARLRREVQEAQSEYAKQKAAASAHGEADQTDGRLTSLSAILDDISKPIGAPAPSVAPIEKPIEANVKVPQASTNGTIYTVSYAPNYQQTHALAKAADFDRRLLALENSLGISLSSGAEAGSNGLPRAVLPTLDSMEKQISTIAQASTANLDAISRRVRALAQDQDKLNESRQKAKALQDELGRSVSSNPEEETEQDTKINALYAILPTIENLTPMLPSLLDRLRSLRAIHSDAAKASELLDEIQQRQADMASELKQWNEGLTKLETAIQDGDKTGQANMETMQDWVKELEAKMAKLS